MSVADAGAVVLFDGVCALCAWSVRFVTPRDLQGYFRFVALQSPLGQQLLQAYRLEALAPDSVVLIEQGRAWLRSDAALRIARHLRGPWRGLSLLLAAPQPLRDAVYDFIAARRYRWFGRVDACPWPAGRGGTSREAST